jgi:reversibly glycosylated polypeptide / UDP-arabinopyranose mutase
MNISVVIATNREDSMKRWLPAWKAHLEDCELIIVQDTPHVDDMALDRELSGYARCSVKRYSWEEIDADLGNRSWVIPRKSSAIKSYGFLKATRDIIWTLDDDCFPESAYGDGKGYLNYAGMVQLFFKVPCDSSAWHNTIHETGLYPRGFPYSGERDPKPVGIWHGLWSNIPDLDGVTALAHPDFRTEPSEGDEVVPYGKFFPMCGMNLAFRRELLPAMYFQLQGHKRNPYTGSLEKLPFDRFDDIWAGLFAKRIADRLGYAVISGAPSIMHTKESDPQTRVEKEAPGIEVHESFWKAMAQTGLSSETVAGCYRQFADEVCDFGTRTDKRRYWDDLSLAMNIWTELAP